MKIFANEILNYGILFHHALPLLFKLLKLINLYHIRTNIGGYNIWRFVEIIYLARY